MKQFIIDICLKILWKLSDDAIMSCEYLKDYYSDVPKELEEVIFTKEEFHYFDKEDKKKALKWIDTD